MRLTLGRTGITPGALERLTPDRLFQLIERHRSGDWGELCEADKRANDRDAGMGGHVLSNYAIDATKAATGDNRVWIETAADRSHTTILLPEER